jgi:tetratricopeptide (TPR) repeat protein
VKLEESKRKWVGMFSNSIKRGIAIVIGILVFFSLASIRPLLRYSTDLARGEKLTQEGDYKAAFYAYGDAIRRSPDDPTAYFKRAIAMSKAMSHSKAQIDLNDVIRLAPKFGPAYRLRAIAERAQGLEKKAMEDDVVADKLGAPTDLDAIYVSSPAAVK